MEEAPVLLLKDEEGQEHQFGIIDIVEIAEDQYAILVPLDKEGNEVEEAIILKVDTDENGEEVLCEIEDEDEWEMVAEAWEQMADEEDD